MIFKKRTNKTDIGNAAEEAACRYLKKQGLKLVATNYRCRLGEIDLIMDHDHTLVFVEVRFRRQSHFGSPLDSVTRSKQRKVKAAAQCYLLEKKLGENRPLRFDVVGITSTDINWVQNAF